MAKVPKGFELVEELPVPGGFEVVSDVTDTAPPQQPEQGLLGTAIGALDIAGLAGTEIAKEGIKGISAVGGLLSPIISGDPQQSIASAEALQASLPTFQLGEEGQRLLATLSERFKDSPEIVQELFNAASTLGPSIAESAFQATEGLPPQIRGAAAAVAGAVPGALEAATVVRGARALPDIAEFAAPTIEAAAEVGAGIFKLQSPTKKRIAKLIQEGSTDVETARFQLATPVSGERIVPPVQPKSKLAKALGIGGPRVKSDTKAIEAINQGFDEGVIAAIKGSTPDDKSAMKQMVNIMEKSKRNARFAVDNRPSDIAGKTLMTRVGIIQKANSEAGKNIDRVAKSLKGKEVEFQPAIDSFVEDLTDMGISIDDNLKPDFTGSIIEGLTGPENVINRLMARMKKTRAPDAFEVHRMKKFIDEQVTFGKNAEGLAGQTEGVLKSLRHDLDEALDTNFPEYNKVNTQYSETRDALDSLQDVAGRKLNLKGANVDKSTGTLLRRVLSNAQSRINLLDSVNEIEGVAKKFEFAKVGKLDPRLIEGPRGPSKIKGDLLTQLLFVDELDAVFGTTARTSLQGQTEQAIRTAAEAVVSPTGAVIRGVGKLSEKARGINQEGKFKAISAFLAESLK